MAFSDVVQRTFSAEKPRHWYQNDSLVGLGVGIALALLIGGAWLQQGFLFGTDWPGPRHFEFPRVISSNAPLDIALAGVSWLIGPEATGKLLVIGILIAAAALSYRAVSVESVAARVAGAILFTANPFVYGRLHYGQLFLLAGYALLPWVAARLRNLCSTPTWSRALLLAVSVSLVGVFTAHLVLIAGLLIAVVSVAYVVAAERRLAYLESLVPALGLTAIATIALSAYWVGPLAIGRGLEASVIAGTASGDFQAYAAVADPKWGLLPNLLGLYGFWAEASDRFTSMKAFVPVWPAILILILVISGVGAASADRARHRAWVAGLLIAAAIGLVLEAGNSDSLIAPLVQWLDWHFALYRGMRDAGKWGALIALVYSQLFGLGVAAVVARLGTLKVPAGGVEWLAGGVIGLLIALPLYYGNGLLFGSHGEIKPSQYPSGWYAADQALSSDPHPGRTLFLPWHEYMSYSFVRNQNNVIASPAPTFFSVPVLTSMDPEVPGIAPPSTSDQVDVTQLIQSGSRGDWATVLASRGIKYVLVAHEVDWKQYTYLSSLHGFEEVSSYGTIDLYRNAMYPPSP